MAPVYEAFYEDEMGKERVVAALAHAPASDDDIRQALTDFIERTKGDEAAREWHYKGPQFREK